MFETHLDGLDVHGDVRKLGQRPESIIAARRSLLRGTIFDANGQVLASSQVIDGVSGEPRSPQPAP